MAGTRMGDFLNISHTNTVYVSTDGTTDFGAYRGSGSPEGVITANVASLYHDLTNGELYLKETGSGNTGWTKLSAEINLGYSASGSGGTITNSGGTNASLILADTDDAGLMAPGDYDKLAFITITQAVNLDDVEDDLAQAITLTGVAVGSAHLGTFTGTTITDNVTIKVALQELETAVEATTSRVQDVVEEFGDLPTSGNTDGDIIWVKDASGDPEVTSGSAGYIWDGTSWFRFAEGDATDIATDLATGTRTTTTYEITSSTGANVTVLAATASLAGMMTAADKDKVDKVNSYTQTYGDGVAKQYTITHNLGTLNVNVNVKEVSSGEIVYPTVSTSGTNQISITHGVVIASNAMRVLVTKVNQ